MNSKILFIFPKWPKHALWGHFKYHFPPLGLLTLAGITPPDFEVEFIDENVQDVDLNTDANLVVISVMTPLAPRAYHLGDLFRSVGKTVIMGGIHVSWLPDEGGNHANCVVIGESEDIWPQVLEDFKNNCLKQRYHAGFADLTKIHPYPRRDLLSPKSYLIRSSIQMTRGCPHNCEYCSVTAFSGHRFRHRSVDSFVHEFEQLPDRFVFIVDDNILSNKIIASELLERLRGSGKWWGSQVTISVADDQKLLKQMALSGCKSLFIGFESLDQENLQQIGKKFVSASKNAERIKKIQDHGIGIHGSFIVGLDHDRESVFDQLYNFIITIKIESFLISVPTPFPGTRMTKRLEAEGRVLTKDWSLYDMSTVVFQPINFSARELQRKYDELNMALYSIKSILSRSLKLKKNSIIFLPQNLAFRKAWKKLLILDERKELY